jgi:Zn-dependent protease
MGNDLTILIIVLISILVSMTLHEAMHAFVSYWLGDDTAKHHGRLTFNPLAHIDPLTTVILPLLLVMAGAPPFGAAKPVPFNPYRLRYGEYGAALVGIAGPLTNLLLALFASGILRIFADSLPNFAIIALGLFIIVNLSFFIFNMIPFPPLDGSRLLYAIAPDGLRRFMEQIESLGFVAIMLFFVIFYSFLTQPFSNLLNWSFGLLTGGGQIFL